MAIVIGSACASLLAAGRHAGGWRRDATVIAVAAGAFGLNLVPAMASVQRPAGIAAGWLPAFEWLRQESEEPFGDPAYYHARYDAKTVPEPRSTVMLWWDYGYTLMTAGRRVPVAIPTGAGGGTAAQFFTEGDEARALELLAATRSRYVFMDDLLPFSVTNGGPLLGKFQAIAQTAGQSPSRYFEVFFVREPNQLRPVYLFFEDYYRSMAFRLGVLGGQAVASVPSAEVVSWTVETVPGFGPVRVITGLDTFPTHEAATQRLQQLGAGNHAIVGRSPHTSVVPLPALERFRRVYATSAPGAFNQGAVQIFEVQ
jgi:asparagine N-glycosylation enzyme membrane subunit Stt3